MCIECAKRVVNILDKMEKGGTFDRLSDEEREQERMTMGMRLRAEMGCPGGEPEPEGTVAQSG